MDRLPMLLPLPPNRVRRNYRGGLLLDELDGISPPADGDRPEDWIASTVPARNPGLAMVRDEGLATATAPDGSRVLLRDLLARHAEHFLGPAHVASLGTQLGFLVKLLDSAMRLHVQAHPTADFARRHLNSRWGKLETYVILGVRPGSQAYIRLGFQRPPSPAEWRRIVLEQDIAAMDACFDRIAVSPGQVWVVPGGVPHAIGPGLLVLETMEPTDLVVRCEFERDGIVVPPEARFMGRDPEFAMRIFDYTPLSVSQVHAKCRVTPTVLCRQPGLLHERLIGPEQTDCFVIERVTATGAVAIAKPQAVQICVVAQGAGKVRVGDEQANVRRGSRLLAAAAGTTIECVPAGQSLQLLLCSPGR